MRERRGGRRHRPVVGDEEGGIKALVQALHHVQRFEAPGEGSGPRPASRAGGRLFIVLWASLTRNSVAPAALRALDRGVDLGQQQLEGGGRGRAARGGLGPSRRSRRCPRCRWTGRSSSGDLGVLGGGGRTPRGTQPAAGGGPLDERTRGPREVKRGLDRGPRRRAAPRPRRPGPTAAGRPGGRLTSRTAARAPGRR